MKLEPLIGKCLYRRYTECNIRIICSNCTYL